MLEGQCHPLCAVQSRTKLQKPRGNQGKGHRLLWVPVGCSRPAGPHGAGTAICGPRNVWMLRQAPGECTAMGAIFGDSRVAMLVPDIGIIDKGCMPLCTMERGGGPTVWFTAGQSEPGMRWDSWRSCPKCRQPCFSQKPHEKGTMGVSNKPMLGKDTVPHFWVSPPHPSPAPQLR